MKAEGENVEIAIYDGNEERACRALRGEAKIVPRESVFCKPKNQTMKEDGAKNSNENEDTEEAEEWFLFILNGNSNCFKFLMSSYQSRPSIGIVSRLG